MARGIGDLRSKVENQFSSWDSTGDGKLDADDIMKTFDKSGDGLLDESEIAPLVAQLSDQIDFNNALLEEMSRLEESQLKSQEDTKVNKQKLAQALSVAESSRAESKEWRRKFTVSQEVADGSSKKLTELRVDYNAIKREKDVLELRLEDLNRKQQSTVDSLDKVESDCDRLGKEKEEEAREFAKQRDVLGQKLMALGSTNNELVAVGDRQRSQIARLEETLSSLRESHRQKEEELASMEKKVDQSITGKENVLVRERQLEDELTAVKAKKIKFEKDWEESCVKVDALNCEVESLSTDLDAVRGELRSAEETVATLKREAGDLKEENETLSNNLEESNAEIRSITKAKNDARLHHERKLGEQQEKIAALAEDMRRESESHVNDLQKKAGEMDALKSGYEVKIAEFEGDIDDLRELLQLKNDHSATTLAEMQIERETYDDTIRCLKSTINEKNAEIEERKEEHEKMISSSAKSLAAMKTRQQEIASGYVASIEKMQQALKAIKEENNIQKESMNEMSGQFVTLATFVRSLEASQSKPVNNWYNEVVKSMELLVEQNSAVKAALENSKDDLKRATLEKLDQKNDNLLLEEEVNRLEHDISMLGGETSTKDNERADLIKKHNKLVENLESEAKKNLDLLEKYKQKLTESEQKRSAMVSEGQKGGETLADAHKHHTERYNKMESSVASLEAQLKKLQREHASILEQRDTHQKQAEDLERALRIKNNEGQNVEKRHQEKNAAEEAKMKKIMQSVSDGNRTNQQLQKQVEQTKKLLLTIQQQKHNLTEECAQLKGELDAIYQRGIKK